MSGDFRRESHAPVAIERLRELIPEIDNDLATVSEFVNACFAGEHSDLSRLEAFDADFYAQVLYDNMALARAYFEQLGIGPDAESLLREAEKLRDDVHDYGVELVRLADAVKGDAAAEFDILKASGELHDRAILLNLDLLAVEAAYGTAKDLFARIEGASESSAKATAADGPGRPKQYLTSWREILDALELPNNEENKGKVRRLVESYEGPIALPSRGGQPRAEKTKLIEWWNALENRFTESDQRIRDRDATVAATHNYGRDGTVAPNIRGSIKPRRTSSKVRKGPETS